MSRVLLNRMDHAAGSIRENVATLLAELGQLSAEIDALHTDGACPASAYWRDADDPQREPKLYAVHPTDCDHCGVHGPRPEGHARLRSYIGTDPTAQRQTLQAMQRYEQIARLQARADEIQDLTVHMRQLREIARAVDRVAHNQLADY